MPNEPTRYHDIEAIYGTSMRFGFGNTHFNIYGETDEEGVLHIVLDAPIRLDENGITSSFKATQDDDIPNLKTVREWIDGVEQSMNAYVAQKIAELTGGTTGNNVMLLPSSININDVTDNSFDVLMGTLERDKFIDRVVFEVLTPFVKADGSDMQFSVGTDTDKEAFVPKVSISRLQSTLVVDVCKTITSDTPIHIYGYWTDPGEEPEPEPENPYDKDFVQRIDNVHDSVAASFTTDASGNVVNVTLSGDNLVANVADTETFGVVDGDYMDFSVNIPLKETGISRYRIVQVNPALSIYDGKDEFISNQDGSWTKDKSYEIPEEETDFVYSFLMGQSAGADDYGHIWVYDLDSEHPENAFRTYHLKNELNFKQVETEVNTLLMNMGTDSNDITYQDGLGFEYWSAYESTIGVVEDSSKDYERWDVYLRGQVHNLVDEVAYKVPGASLPATMLVLQYDKAIPETGIKAVVRDAYFAHTADDPDSLVSEYNGVHYGESEIYPTIANGYLVFEIPIGESNAYTPMVTITDLETGSIIWQVEIHPELTFLEDEEDPDEGLHELLTVNAKNLPSSTQVMPMAAGDTGVMRVRVLSF